MVARASGTILPCSAVHSEIYDKLTVSTVWNEISGLSTVINYVATLKATSAKKNNFLKIESLREYVREY